MRMRNLLNSRRLRTDTAIFPPQAKDKDNDKEKYKYNDKTKYNTRRGNLLNRREVEERQGAILLPLLLLLLSESVSSVARRPPASSYHANSLASHKPAAVLKCSKN